jgi:hypothetical protein
MPADTLHPGYPVVHIKSDSAERAEYAENQGISQSDLAQNGASGNARQNARDGARNSAPELGPSMTITDVAELLGCSPWTVRQRYLPQGLPCLRASRTGKLVFFREQVVRWILKRQRV